MNVREKAEAIVRFYETGGAVREELDDLSVARAYLALLSSAPADDGEAVTLQWFDGLSGSSDGIGGWPKLGPLQWSSGAIVNGSVETGAILYHAEGRWILKTRRQVRNLLSAFGIQSLGITEAKK